MASVHQAWAFASLQGFHKILKKHDKMLPHAPCQQFYVAHLHQQKWVQVRAQGGRPARVCHAAGCCVHRSCSWQNDMCFCIAS